MIKEGNLIIIYTKDGWTKGVVTEIYDNMLVAKREGLSRVRLTYSDEGEGFDLLTRNNQPIKARKNIFGKYTFKEVKQ